MQNTYWNHQGKYEDWSKALADKVPARGEADRFHLEIYRCMSRLYHDYHNNDLGNFDTLEYLFDHLWRFIDVLTDTAAVKGVRIFDTLKAIKERGGDTNLDKPFENLANVVIRWAWGAEQALGEKDTIEVLVPFELEIIRERCSTIVATFSWNKNVTPLQTVFHQDIPALCDEIERLQAWVNDLQSGMYINCVYCGHRYGPREDTPVSMADVLKKHIEQCPRHPLSTAMSEIEQWQNLLKRALRNEGVDKCVLAKECNCWRCAAYKKLIQASEAKGDQ